MSKLEGMEWEEARGKDWEEASAQSTLWATLPYCKVPFLMETLPGPSLWKAFGVSGSEHTSRASSSHCAAVIVAPSFMCAHIGGDGGGNGGGEGGDM